MTSKKKPVSDADKALFRRAVAGARPLNSETVVPPSQPIKKIRVPIHKPLPLEDPPFADRLADTLDSASIDGDTPLSFNRAGISAKDLQILKRGEFSNNAVLDLHGQTVVEARQSLINFLHSSQQRHWRFVRIIHGKGKTSSQGYPILKNQVANWLQQHEHVLAYCSARSHHGGTGAVNVLLKNSSKA